MRSYPVKKNHIVSAVGNPVRSFGTDKQTKFLLLYHKDNDVRFSKRNETLEIHSFLRICKETVWNICFAWQT